MNKLIFFRNYSQTLVPTSGQTANQPQTQNSPSNRNFLEGLENDPQLRDDFSIAEMNVKAISKEFPKKFYLIGGFLKPKASILHFFKSIRTLDLTASNINNEFTCKFFNIVMLSTFKDFTNLYKHLNIHTDYKKWHNLYKDRKLIRKPTISKELFVFIKFICSSNLALNQLKNPYLIQMLRHSFKVPSYRTTRNTLLPEVYGKLFSVIDRKLNGAKTISLMADIWTSGIMSDFIGIAASLGYDMSNKELIVIGFERMPPGSHTSESIKFVMENILNKFTFNKSKISCKFLYNMLKIRILNMLKHLSLILAICCDQGSNFVRLFSQLEHAQIEEVVEEPETGSEIVQSLNDSMVDMNIQESDRADGDDDDERLTIRTRTLGFEAVDAEISEMSEVLEQISYTNRVTYNSTAFERNTPIEPLFANETNDLSIQFGSSNIARFCCACHKLNIVIKTAVDSQGILKDILKKLGSFAANSRNNIEINRVFTEANCRPVLENKTRWFSQLYVLMWAQNCYKKDGIFINFYLIKIKTKGM
ncbi:MAG: hypothetical protein K2X69_07005 [Silvanigrellaceae bacterium]|nr:hypothetical protein [Silvanigrellaceae bacterium]